MRVEFARCLVLGWEFYFTSTLVRIHSYALPHNCLQQKITSYNPSNWFQAKTS